MQGYAGGGLLDLESDGYITCTFVSDFFFLLCFSICSSLSFSFYYIIPEKEALFEDTMDSVDGLGRV